MKNKMNNMNNSDARLEVRLGQSMTEAMVMMNDMCARMSSGKIVVDGKYDMSMYAGLDYDNMGAVISRYPMVSMDEVISSAISQGLHDADVAYVGMYGNDIDGDYPCSSYDEEYDEYANSKAYDDARYEASMAALCVKHGYIKVEGGYIPEPVSCVRTCETCVNGSGEYFENHCCCEAWNYIGECHYEKDECSL